ncbi:MAG: homoserine kinase [Mariprofundales bacterium]|nr:homoserine kinase [Mariprofundales bacterium]
MSVYTELTRDEIIAIVGGYNLGGLHNFTNIAAGIENSNFFIDTDRGRFVLTIFERLDRNSIPWFMQLMHHLSHHGLPCPDVQSQRNDGAMLFDYGEKSGCIVSCLPGSIMDQLSETQLRSAGVALAQLHAAGEDFRPVRSNPTGAEWLDVTANQVMAEARNRYGDNAVALLAEEISWQKAHHTEGLPQGIIHGDYFCDNILFDGDDVAGIIDFYYAHTAPWVMDIAIAINALAIKLGEDDTPRMMAFMEGYQRVRRLTDAEQQALPALLRLAALRFWLSRLYDAIFPRDGAMTQSKDPEEYRHKLLLHRNYSAHALFF